MSNRVLPPLLGERRERDPGPQGRGTIAGGNGFVDRRLQRYVDGVPLAEPDRELEVGEAQLTLCFRVEVGATLEVIRRDVELHCEAAECLDGRLACPRFDAGDIGVRDSGGSELTLGKTPIQPQALEPLPDRLARGWRSVGVHRTHSCRLPPVRQLVPLDNGQRGLGPWTIHPESLVRGTP